MKWDRIKRKLAVMMTLCMVACVGVAANAADRNNVRKYSKGDVSGDGRINSADALLVLRHAVKMTSLSGSALVAADLTGEGTVNSADALEILKIAVELSPVPTEPATVKPTTKPSTQLRPAEYPASMDVKTEGDKAISYFTGRTYELTFIDDFNGTTLNKNNWNFDRRNSNTGEWQSYQEKNVTVENGELKITLKKENREYPAYSGDGTEGGKYYKDTEYTSSKINSKGKVKFLYGMIEMYGKAPSGQGVWPAFWTMGEHHGWPYGGEIDIFEMVGGGTNWGETNRDGEYTITLHWTAPSAVAPWAGGPEPYHQGIGTFKLPGQKQGDQLGDAYHLYGIEWDQDQIIGYIDNVKFAEVPISLDSDIPWPNEKASQNEVQKMIQAMSVAFHKEHYIIVNLALGGDWAMGTEGNKPWNSNIPGEGYNHVDSNLPMDFRIDWIKVWQLVE